MQKYSGHCHCGVVRYEIETDLAQVIECNCSHCYAKGLLLTFVPPEQFRLIMGEENLTEYRFNQKRIAHLFCKTCGVQSFARGEKRDGTPMVAINVRCLYGVDTKSLTLTPVNGKDF
ncbi:MAG: GFA family protein [Minisyncoccia bacterium]